LNINYPPTDVPKGVVVAAQGQLATLGGSPFPLQLLYGCFGDCAGAAVGETVAGGITGIAPDLRDDVKNSDSSLFAEGFITLVPFQVDYTAKSYLQFKSILNGLSY
jgi:hypothetical protein